MSTLRSAFIQVFARWFAVVALMSVAMALLVISKAAGPLLISLTGLALICYGAWPLWRAKQAKNWLPINATIVDAAVSDIYYPGRVGYFVYYPVVHFRYSVSGVDFDQGRYSLSSRDFSSQDKAEIEALVATFLAGAPVVARLNPDAPEDAVIMPVLSAERRSHYLACAIGGVIVLVISVFVWRMILGFN